LNFNASQHAELILKMHDQIKANIEAMIAKYQQAVSKGRKHVTIEPDDLVWVHFKKDKFLDFIKSKLLRRAMGTFKVLHKSNDYAYEI
jgi:hypothetical protein